MYGISMENPSGKQSLGTSKRTWEDNIDWFYGNIL
jgi:hypothetical protein